MRENIFNIVLPYSSAIFSVSEFPSKLTKDLPGASFHLFTSSLVDIKSEIFNLLFFFILAITSTLVILTKLVFYSVPIVLFINDVSYMFEIDFEHDRT